MEKTSIFV